MMYSDEEITCVDFDAQRPPMSPRPRQRPPVMLATMILVQLGILALAVCRGCG